jgi:hypothetical protein
MNEKLLDSLTPRKFDDLVETFVERSEPDTISFEAFGQAVERLERMAREVRPVSGVELRSETPQRDCEPESIED